MAILSSHRPPPAVVRRFLTRVCQIPVTTRTRKTRVASASPRERRATDTARFVRILPPRISDMPDTNPTQTNNAASPAAISEASTSEPTTSSSGTAPSVCATPFPTSTPLIPSLTHPPNRPLHRIHLHLQRNRSSTALHHPLRKVHHPLLPAPGPPPPLRHPRRPLRSPLQHAPLPEPLLHPPDLLQPVLLPAPRLPDPLVPLPARGARHLGLRPPPLRPPALSRPRAGPGPPGLGALRGSHLPGAAVRAAARRGRRLLPDARVRRAGVPRAGPRRLLRCRPGGVLRGEARVCGVRVRGAEVERRGVEPVGCWGVGDEGEMREACSGADGGGCCFREEEGGVVG